MKKTLIALAAVAATGAAFAQSTVTLSGNIDLAYLSAKTADGGKFTGLQNGPTSTSKIIFAGTEDLGGGLKANFKINSTIVADRGNTFIRQANPNLGTGAAATAAGNQGLAFGDRDLYISLSGGFGELRAGRNQSISDDNNNAGANAGSIWTYFMANSAAQAGVNNSFGGAAPALGAAGRIADSFKYASPVFNGFQVQALYGFGERDNLSSEGVVTEAQVSYVQGPLAVSYSMGKIAAAPSDATTFGALGTSSCTTSLALTVYTTTCTAGSSTQAALAAASAGVEVKESRLMASYDLGVARLAAGTYSQKTAGTAADKASHLTVTVPMNAWTFGGTYITVKDAQATTTTAKLDGYSVSAKYALSKRTYGYAFYRSMDKTAAQTATPTGLYVGMNHAF